MADKKTGFLATPPSGELFRLQFARGLIPVSRKIVAAGPGIVLRQSPRYVRLRQDGERGLKIGRETVRLTQDEFEDAAVAQCAFGPGVIAEHGFQVRDALRSTSKPAEKSAKVHCGFGLLGIDG